METNVSISGLNHSFVLVPHRIPTRDDGSSTHENHFKIANVFRHHVTDPDKIAPYEVAGFPNYPGSSNLLYLPIDIYYTLKSLGHSIDHGDTEEICDASARLLGVPANFVSAAGFLVGYGIGLGIIPASVVLLLPIAYGAGIALCIIEGAVDAWSLNRQHKFENQFDFDFLSNLRYMVSDFESSKSSEAIEEMAELVNKNPESLKQLYGEQFENVKNLFNQMNEELEENPYDADLILKKYASPLEEIARLAVMKDLKHLEEEFLQLNPEEVVKIHSKVLQKNQEKSLEELQEITIKKLREELAIKKKRLARRVRPWMVSEASETVSPILSGVIKNDSEAIKEGLRLADDIHSQSKKKKIAHILGIIALVFAAASLVTMCVTCPAFLPFLLVGIATTFALARVFVYSGSLDSRGWTFEPKKCVPEFIRKRIWEEPKPEIKQQKFRQKVVNPLDYEYESVLPSWSLSPEKMEAILPSLSPSQGSVESQKSHHVGRLVSPSRLDPLLWFPPVKRQHSEPHSPLHLYV